MGDWIRLRKIIMERFREIFTGLERAHGCTYVDKKGVDGLKVKGKSFVKTETVTEKHWEDHLKGIEPSLGIIPINENNECRWGCIDIDVYAEFNHKKLINKIKSMNLPLMVFNSKSGGAHVFLFTKDFVPAKLMRDRLISISAVLGHGGAEVFPKQIELKSKDDTGNFLNLPYFNHENTVRYCFKSSGEAVTLPQFLQDIVDITPEQLQNLIIKRPESEYDDGPPCLESLTKEKLDDGRDRVMFQYRVYAKKKWPESWADKLDIFNHKHFVNPYRHDEITKFRKDNKEYGFKCTEEPMCNHCDKLLCKTRKFGIGTQSMFPPLKDLQVVKTEPPIYRLNVDGERIELKAEDLQEQRLFIRACMNQIYTKPPKIKPKDFDEMINLLMMNKEEVEAPAGSSMIEQLKQHVENYCLGRATSGATREDLEAGNVWNYQAHHHFVFTNFFYQYLARHKWPEKPQFTLYVLREHCGYDTNYRVALPKKKISVIRLPEFEKESFKPKDRVFKQEDAF